MVATTGSFKTELTIKLYIKTKKRMTPRVYQKAVHTAMYDLKAAVVGSPEMEFLTIVYNKAGAIVAYTVDGGEYDSSMTLDELIIMFTDKEGTTDE